MRSNASPRSALCLARLVSFGVRLAVLAGVLVTALASSSVSAQDPAEAGRGPHVVRVEGTFAVSLRRDDDRDKWGFGVGVGYEYRLSRWLGLEGLLFFFYDTATTEIYTLPYSTLCRSNAIAPGQELWRGVRICWATTRVAPTVFKSDPPGRAHG